jgi:hypothetical protein
VRKISPREVRARSKRSRKSLEHGCRAASPTASNGAAEANRLHRFVRFAPRNARQSAFSGPSPQKNFALVNPLLRMLSRLRKRVDAERAAAREREKSKQRRMTKTRNSSAFLQCAKNKSQMHAPPKICSMRILRNTAGRLCGGGGARHLHTKLSGVTVIFFLL